ncbi:hypothetical protein BED47_00690 [Gottfriedia luciferensis]|uniref:Uncharacterized protein n=1 Tax=Gottfriedia luciferensis TaxID=178774 RepID=A0ABX2ZVF5_9BACI|nr:hypothetical protein [Gottfriedia luciferensis]ODG93720.1 hypothetical protein BED47_00690 [Gottfriedia luciferensis]
MQYFFCHNKKVSDFIKSKGIDYITVAIDPKTRILFSLYEITLELKEVLDEYKLNKKLYLEAEFRSELQQCSNQ